ncbi:MAG: tetratricopeptide repeat protein [Elusimicrobiota bacterium]
MTILACLLLLARPAAAGPHLTPAAETQLDEGITRLYSLDYAASRAAFRRLIELEPDNPFGYLFEAGGIWWESSQEFGLFKDTPTLQGLFEEDVEAAQRKADAYIDSKDPQTRADGYFVSGMALGTLGQWRLMKGHWLDAYFAGKKAVKHLKKCVKLDPAYYDAYLGLGVFDYQAAHLSGIAKLGFLFGVRGDEKRGIAEISLAVEKARYANRQASEFLLCIFLIDRRDYARALPVVQRLRVEFPASPYYVFIEALIRDRLGDRDRSVAVGRELFAIIERDPAAFRPKWLSLICGLSGSDCLDRNAAAAALPWFDRAIETSGEADAAPDGYHALLHLFRGQLLDLLSRRDEAVADYRKTESLADFDSSAARASACESSPCGRDQILRLLRALSKARPETN